MNIFFFLILLVASGFLGALARQTIVAATPPAPVEGQTEPPKAPGFDGFSLFSALILGAAAAFIVPLFLSIGNNTIITKILTVGAADMFSNMLIVVGFCVLAGATAPSFIDNLAKKALVVAEANQQMVRKLAVETQETKEIVAEQRENAGGTFGPQSMNRRTLDQIDLSSTGWDPATAPPSQKALVEAIASVPFQVRTIGGITADLGMDRSQAANAARDLVAKGVLETRTSSTGVTLYGLKTPPTQ